MAPTDNDTTPLASRYRWIDRQEDLNALVGRLKPLKELALDTEADNMYHYHNRICLFQLHAGGTIWILDALAGLDLDTFVDSLRPKRLIMHGSDFDLRLMADRYRFRPAEIFDTMLAAQLLGLRQIGLGSLIEHYFGVTLPKGHQKSNWSRRPLPDLERGLRHRAGGLVHRHDRAGDPAGPPVDVLATDVSARCLEVAERGVYGAFEMQRGVSDARRERHFDRVEAG